MDRNCVPLVTDLQIPGMSGLELQAKLAEDSGRIAIIFITAYGVPWMRAQAMQAGAIEFLDKPFETTFCSRLSETLSERNLSADTEKHGLHKVLRYDEETATRAPRASRRELRGCVAAV